ncbi:hypothetical protein LCGC14_0796240 [marine sediment metagenome]|uniref:Uncharacterized protein n=1 Tax=marine sediment metagenome TaxID=412755 RepID=A0A0F9PQW3_9ZZZZ
MTIRAVKALSNVWRGYLENIEFPFGKGDLTSNGIQFSDAVTESAGTATAVETVSINPPGEGDIIEVMFSITVASKSSDGVNDVAIVMQARNDAGTWVTIGSYTETTPNTTYAEQTLSGTFEVETNFNSVPFDIRVTVADEDGAKTATAKVKNSSWVKVKYAPKTAQG